MQLIWFRRDLRTLDNTALTQALKTGDSVAAIYIATPGQWQHHSQSAIQTDLIFRRLGELKQQLSDLNICLYYSEKPDYRQAVKEVIRVANSAPGSSVTIHLNRDYELNEIKRDSLLSELADRAGHKVCCYHDKCCLPPGSVLNNSGRMFKVFTPFKKRWLAVFSQTQVTVSKPTPALGYSYDLPCDRFYDSVSFHYPRVCSQGYPVSDKDILTRLKNFCSDTIREYHQLRDIPSQAATSGLSPYLSIGALSVRQCIARMTVYEPSVGQEKWLDELIWREFYQHLSAHYPGLSTGSPFHLWGHNLRWQHKPKLLQAWKTGNTGYPIVDAAMRQLNTTGWMHNRLRMITASFLIKDLLTDWHSGEAYFMQKLIDGDYASNNGGWQWCASTGCDGQPYFRIFNPVTQGEKFDPQGEFICRWIPELKSVPVKYIHKPWLWSEASELNYPPPIVDHKVQREIALSLYKEAKG